MQCSFVLADDHAIFRSGLKALLELEKDFEILDEAGDGRQAYLATIEHDPDLVIMDLSMPNTNGREALSQIKQRCPKVKVLILTAHKEEEYVRSTLEAGADGYTLKDDTHEELLMAIKSVVNGKRYVSASVSRHVVDGYLRPSSSAQSVSKPSINTLTRREREVLKLIAEGKKNREIAGYLSLSPKTIEKHRANLMGKLKFKNMPALIFYAIEHGMVNV